MKNTKSDGGRHSLGNNAAAPGETGPLFPRLHVSETENAGPRAPPRNKMALFEQFTVPSNRCTQPSKLTGAASNQQQQYDYRHLYIPYYTPSVPFSTLFSSHPQLSHGMSSCVTSSASDQDSVKTSRLQMCEKSCPSRATAKDDGGTTLSSSLEKKARLVRGDAPVQSATSGHFKDTKGVYTASLFEKLCDKFASVSSEPAEVQVITEVRNDSPEPMSIGEEVLDLSVEEVKGCDQDRAEAQGSLKYTNKSISHLSDEAPNELKHSCLELASDQPNQQLNADCEKVLSEVSSFVRKDSAEVAVSKDLKSSADRDNQVSQVLGSCLIGNFRSTSTKKSLSASFHTREDGHNICPGDGEKRDASVGGLSADDSLKGKRESTGDLQSNQVDANDLLKLPQQAPQREPDDLPSSSLSVQSFRPNDVIRAVGQPQFWKARKALLRQQRIFTDQVFQLHRLIKVQQLLAETPGTLIDEQMSLNTVDHCATSPAECSTGREHRLESKAHATDSSKEQRVQDQCTKTPDQPKTMQNPEWYPALGNRGMGSSPYLPGFSLGGVSAWGFPSLGMGQWMIPMPTQGKPSAYQPFAGAFSPGTPYFGLYGPVVLGSVPSMMPYSMPSTGQKSEPREEMSSNLGPPVSAGPCLQATPAGGHVAHGLSGAWPFMQYNNPDNDQRLGANILDRNLFIVSGASNNIQTPVKPLRTSVKQQTWSEATHAGGLNINGLESSFYHSENSSPSNTSGPNFKSSAQILSTLASRKTDHNDEQTEQQAGSSNAINRFRTSGSSRQHKTNVAGDGENRSRTTMRWSKCQQDDQMPEGAEEMSGRQFDHSGNALNLFPSVPSLSADCEQRSSKQTREDWKGRVIKAVPHPAVAASQSTAGILLSLQRERQQ